MSGNPWLTQRITCTNISGELVKRQSNEPVITAKESCSTHKLAVPQKRKRRAVNFPHCTGAKNNRNLLAIEGYIYFIASAPKGKCERALEREMKSAALGRGRQQWKQKRWESAHRAIIWLGCQLEFHFLTEQGFARFTVVISLWKCASVRCLYWVRIHNAINEKYERIPMHRLFLLPQRHRHSTTRFSPPNSAN